MSSSNSNLSSLVRQFSGSTKNTTEVTRLVSATALSSQNPSAGESAPGIPKANDSRANSIAGEKAPQGIKFGSPSSSSSGSSNSGSTLTSLLSQAGQGGIGGVLSGSLGLGGVTGIAGVVSSLINLFGGSGKKTLPPLVEFQLPSSQQETVYLSSKGTTLYQGIAVQSVASANSNQGTASQTQQPQVSAGSNDAEWIKNQSSEIAQAVRGALLTSSSLGDVIAEI